jgi:hypothetical protein
MKILILPEDEDKWDLSSKVIKLISEELGMDYVTGWSGAMSSDRHEPEEP